jgi:hypothetical protein
MEFRARLDAHTTVKDVNESIEFPALINCFLLELWTMFMIFAMNRALRLRSDLNQV